MWGHQAHPAEPVVSSPLCDNSVLPQDTAGGPWTVPRGFCSSDLEWEGGCPLSPIPAPSKQAPPEAATLTCRCREPMSRSPVRSPRAKPTPLRAKGVCIPRPSGPEGSLVTGLLCSWLPLGQGGVNPPAPGGQKCPVPGDQPPKLWPQSAPSARRCAAHGLSCFPEPFSSPEFSVITLVPHFTFGAHGVLQSAL